MFFFSAKSGAFVVRVFLVEGLSRSLILSVICCFFLSFFFVLSVLSCDTRKKPKLTRRKSASPLSVPINIGIFSQLFLFLSAVDAGVAARDTKRLTLIVI